MIYLFYLGIKPHVGNMQLFILYYYIDTYRYRFRKLFL